MKIGFLGILFSMVLFKEILIANVILMPYIYAYSVLQLIAIPFERRLSPCV